MIKKTLFLAATLSCAPTWAMEGPGDVNKKPSSSSQIKDYEIRKSQNLVIDAIVNLMTYNIKENQDEISRLKELLKKEEHTLEQTEKLLKKTKADWDELRKMYPAQGTFNGQEVPHPELNICSEKFDPKLMQKSINTMKICNENKLKAWSHCKEVSGLKGKIQDLETSVKDQILGCQIIESKKKIPYSKLQPDSSQLKKSECVGDFLDLSRCLDFSYSRLTKTDQDKILMLLPQELSSIYKDCLACYNNQFKSRFRKITEEQMLSALNKMEGKKNWDDIAAIPIEDFEALLPSAYKYYKSKLEIEMDVNIGKTKAYEKFMLSRDKALEVLLKKKDLSNQIPNPDIKQPNPVNQSSLNKPVQERIENPKKDLSNQIPNRNDKKEERKEERKNDSSNKMSSPSNMFSSYAPDTWRSKNYTGDNLAILRAPVNQSSLNKLVQERIENPKKDLSKQSDRMPQRPRIKSPSAKQRRRSLSPNDLLDRKLYSSPLLSSTRVQSPAKNQELNREEKFKLIKVGEIIPEVQEPDPTEKSSKK